VKLHCLAGGSFFFRGIK